MLRDHEPSQIRARALDLLRDGRFAGDLATASGRLETPLAVHAPDGRLHSWFVPVTVGNQIVAFFQFLPDGTYMRFSSFQRRTGELDGCPAAADWLDPNRIQARAQAQRQAEETSGEPFLTYDRSPDRLVWAVPFTDSCGEVRLVYVAGKVVYVPPPAETYG